MASAKKKLSDLKSGRSKLKVSGGETADVRKKANALVEAFDDYVRNDNLSGKTLFYSDLAIQIEEAGDFKTAVRYLDKAIDGVSDEAYRQMLANCAAAAGRLRSGWYARQIWDQM